MKSSENPISLYIHWPYCLSKCPYCDFASVPCRLADEDLLMPGYERDLDRWLTGRPIRTIFFGGGTPSLMSVRFLERLMNDITRHTSLVSDCEITLEANPDAITREKMKDFYSLGVNRFSLGVQALTDSDLRFLGRRHTVRTALQRIEEAKTVFDRINIDLIYARPDQTVAAWQKELQQALSLGVEHYSLYQLTIEDQTVFGRRGVRPADEETARNLYLLTDEVMAAAGRPAYEVSNYAGPGFECRHNMAYWLGRDYIGIGPAAHGRIGRLAVQNPPRIDDWLRDGPTVETLTRKQKLMERLLMGLRLRRHAFPVRDLPADRIDRMVGQGLLSRTQTGIIPTLAGTLVLDRLILELLPD